MNSTWNFIICICVLVVGIPCVVMGADIWIPDDYGTIVAGVSAAIDGDTVWVRDGTYTGEGNKNILTYGKRITIRSQNGPFNCIIDCENAGRGFACATSEENDTVIQGFTVMNGNPGTYGGGMYFNAASPTVSDCILMNNITLSAGGGIYCNNAAPRIINCMIMENETGAGGGLYCEGSNIETIEIINCTIVGNNAGNQGGGIGAYIAMSSISVKNCIVWNNNNNQIIMDAHTFISVTYSDIQGGWSGTGNIDDNPLFVLGRFGEYYLSQFAAGQGADSPCINAGSDPAADICWNSSTVCLDAFTTRTDNWEDIETVDMGFHYSLPACIRDGDVTLDDQITAGDAQAAFSIVMGTLQPSPEQECAADCNDDGSITAGDAQMIFSKAMGTGECAEPIFTPTPIPTTTPTPMPTTTPTPHL